jgi:hypothetical protein
MLKPLQYLLLELRVQIGLLDLYHLVYGPLSELLHLAPPLIHRLRIQYHQYELEIVFLETRGQTRSCGGGDSSLQPGVPGGLEELVGVLPLVEVPQGDSRLAGVLLRLHYLPEGRILHRKERKSRDVLS